MGVVMTIIVTAGIIFKSRDMTIRAPTVRAKNSLPVRRKELNDPLILFMILFYLSWAILSLNSAQLCHASFKTSLQTQRARKQSQAKLRMRKVFTCEVLFCAATLLFWEQRRIRAVLAQQLFRIVSTGRKWCKNRMISDSAGQSKEMDAKIFNIKSRK